ncbi:hypothetical protein BGW38_001039, partial [Lunasporangiospora selenospora]
MQKDPFQITPAPVLGAGAKAGAVDVAAAAVRVATAHPTSSNGVHTPMPCLESQSAFRRRSLCSIDQPGVVMTKLPQELEDSQHEFGSKLVVIMVGLPARGKSYLVKKLQRYLTWLQYDTK